MQETKRNSNYRWVILAISFLMVFVCLGFCSGNKGLYLTAITDALGIKRSLFSINDSCRFIATAVINLFFGSLIGRFGLRKMTAFGFATLIASTITYACANNIFVFYIGGTLLGIGLAFTTTTIASSIMRRWFKKDIGKYMGIVFASNGIGSAVAAQIISPMINEEGNPFGYRKSYLVVAGILLVVGLVVVLLMRENPNDEEQLPAEGSKKKSRGMNWIGTSFDNAKRRPYFWLTAICIFFTGFVLQGISGVYAAHMRDVGIDHAFVATIVSLFSLTLTATKVLVGSMYDRYGLRVVMIVCQVATIVAFLVMAALSATVTGMVLAVLFALLYALALPLETLVIPLIVGDLFGSVSYDKILGVMTAMNYAGYALGSPLTNLCYDICGSYNPILLLFSALMVPVCIVFQFVIRSARNAPEREVVS